jgi:hypothetical protein
VRLDRSSAIVGAEVGLVGSLILLQVVVLSSRVSQVLVLVAMTFLGYAIPRNVAS